MLEVIYIDEEKAQSFTEDPFRNFERSPLQQYPRLEREFIILKISDHFAAYSQVLHFDSNDFVEFVEVSPDFRGQHYNGEKVSERLIHETFKRCADFSSTLVLSRHTPKGKRSLKPITEKMSAIHSNISVFNEPSV